MRDALAPKTCSLASLLGGSRKTGCRLQDGPGLLRRPAAPRSYHDRCHHNGPLGLCDLPDWDWYDISAHLRCTKCDTVGFVDTRLDWTEVIDFNKAVC